MSRPRAATSVATRIEQEPVLNCCSTQSRSPCCLSPWMARAGHPSWRMLLVRTSQLRFVSQKMMIFDPSLSTICSMILASRRGFSESSHTSTCCLTVLTALRVLLPTCVRTVSFCRKSRAMPSTSLGHVAVKKSVWRSGRICPTIFRICGSNPMSSMRSASSRVRNLISARRTLPRSMKSTRRPGAATTMSAPCSTARSWSRMFSPPPYATAQRSPVL
mmetsp:Transcript_1556/g.3626  ORF Transcript_1556/g.3626 Transcript_1556/m.3626 type:complete len:218 (-) Transcript_1556:699-1352(-)